MVLMMVFFQVLFMVLLLKDLLVLEYYSLLNYIYTSGVDASDLSTTAYKGQEQIHIVEFKDMKCDVSMVQS